MEAVDGNRFIISSIISLLISFIELNQGETEVLAGVFGPVEPKGGRREDELKADLKVLYYPASGHQTPQSTTYQNYLQNMFEDIILLSLHPKSLIQIVVHVLSDDGSVRFLSKSFHFSFRSSTVP